MTRSVEQYLSKTANTIERVEIAFFGGSFTGIEPAKQEYLLKAAYRFIKQGLVHGIRLSTRPDYIDQKRLDLLKHYNVRTVELGVQSFSET